AAVRATSGRTYVGTTTDLWDKSPHSGSYMSSDPQRESLDRNILTLARRALRKADYLKQLKRYYRTNSQNPQNLLTYLRTPQDTTSRLVGVAPGVRMEAVDFAHRPFEVHFDSAGRVKPEGGMADDYNCNAAFYEWSESITVHGKPFFLWLENHPICLFDKKAKVATARTVAYVRSDLRQ